MARGKTVITTILGEMAKRPGRVFQSDTLARALKMNSENVRNSLTAYARNHPGGPVERISSGIFRYNEDIARLRRRWQNVQCGQCGLYGWVPGRIDPKTDHRVPVETEGENRD